MKNNNIRKYLRHILGAIVLVISASCSKDKTEDILPDNSSYSVVKVSVSPYTVLGGDASVAGENDINELHACLFEDGIMTRIFTDLSPDSDFKIDAKSGHLYMVANLPGTPSYGSVGTRNIGMTEEEWLNTKIVHTGGVNLNYFSGMVDLSNPDSGTLALTRGVSRIDVSIDTDESISVVGLVFTNVAQRSYLNSRPTLLSHVEAGVNDVTVNFDSPLQESKNAVAYLCEQNSDDVTAVFTLLIDGKTVVKEVKMPSVLKRNTVYTIKIYKNYTDSDFMFEVVEWENGGDYGMAPNSGRLSVDMDETTFPEGTVMDESSGNIILPYTTADFVLSVDCDDELEYIPTPGLPVEVERIEGGDYIGKNKFRVKKTFWRPGMEQVEWKMMFHRKGLSENYHDDYISFVLPENPVKLEGLINFVDGNEFDFGRYIDNELGVLTVPSDKSVTVEYEEGEGQWIMLDENEGRYRIVGGWRPNDETANGRVQKARLVIANKADGSAREEYTIARRNWGLPVTYLNGIWWCKYNAMGNSKDFADQVLSSDDPAAKAGKSVMDYLRDCTPEEFFRLWKWQYQGKSTQGMQVIDDNGIAKMEGYSPSPVHINMLDAKAMSPDGYELPSVENFDRVFASTSGSVWLMWDGSHNTAWNGKTNIQRRQRRRNDVTVGSVTLSNLIYIGMYNNAEIANGSLVWYGPGAQWNDSGIFHGHYNNMLFAVANPTTGQGWFFSGSMDNLALSKNSAGPNDSRIVRFRKSDVEYIY